MVGIKTSSPEIISKGDLWSDEVLVRLETLKLSEDFNLLKNLFNFSRLYKYNFLKKALFYAAN